MRFAVRILMVAAGFYVLAMAGRIYARKMYIWLPDYVSGALTAAEGRREPVHVFFLFADHFEPGKRADRMRRWESEYPKLARRHRDSGGRVLQHTWFYPGEQPEDANMESLKRLVEGGYGEVELHYHHGGDTGETAGRKFRQAIEYFQRYGFLKTITGETRFAFVHGNWGLDNSNGSPTCGVNRELELLEQLGCFADFTFPSIWQNAQPSLVNSIYRAVDDDRPKSYDRGAPLRVGERGGGGLVIFEGPLMITPTWNARRLFLQVEDGEVHPAVPLSEQRVDLWVRARVHVQGRPDWIFVKVHGHGGSSEEDMQEALGARFDRAMSYLEKRYNDGVHYVLHYVTAREAYNLARAAAAGHPGDPRQYLDWVIPPYEPSRAIRSTSTGGGD